MDAFAESDMPENYLKRALSRLEKERQLLHQRRRRQQSRPVMPDKLIFSELCFEEKKAVAAQLIERIEVAEAFAHIRWTV